MALKPTDAGDYCKDMDREDMEKHKKLYAEAVAAKKLWKEQRLIKEHEVFVETGGENWPGSNQGASDSSGGLKY